jgi:hypothetical protein
MAADFSPLPVTQIALTPALDLGQFAVADSLKRGFVDICQLNHILVAHNDRCNAIDNGPHGQLGLNGYTDLADQDQVEGSLEDSSNLRRAGAREAPVARPCSPRAPWPTCPASARSLNGIC